MEKSVSESIDALGTSLSGPLSHFGRMANSFGTSLNKLVDEFENVMGALRRFTGLFGGGQAVQAVRSATQAVAPALVASKLVKGVRARPGIATTLAVAGGIGLLIYLARKMDTGTGTGQLNYRPSENPNDQIVHH